LATARPVRASLVARALGAQLRERCRIHDGEQAVAPEARLIEISERNDKINQFGSR